MTPELKSLIAVLLSMGFLALIFGLVVIYVQKKRST